MVFGGSEKSRWVVNTLHVSAVVRLIAAGIASIVKSDELALKFIS